MILVQMISLVECQRIERNQWNMAHALKFAVDDTVGIEIPSLNASDTVNES